MKTLWTVAVVSVVSAGCGKKKTTDPGAPVPTADAASLANDPDTTTALVAGTLSDVTLSLNSGDGVSNAQAAALTGDGMSLLDGLSRTRTCTADASAQTATVSLGFSGTGAATFGRFTSTESASGTETRLWSSTAGVSCTANNQYAKIDWAKAGSLAGLTLKVTTSRGRDVTVSYAKAAGTPTLTRRSASQTSGSRTVTWAVPTGATSTVDSTKTINSKVTYTDALTKPDGTTIDLSSLRTTSDPFIVTVTRDNKGVPLTHLITSGTLALTKPSTFYVTSKFSQVLFNLSSSDPCTPVSGTITTAVFAAAGDPAPVKTYTITFAAGTPTIAGDTDATDAFTANIDHKCDFVGND